MSTRGHVGYRKADGSIKAVYNHFDSYPESLGKTLTEFIANKGIKEFCQTVDKGCINGGFRYFPEDYGEEGNDWTVTERGRLNNDYAYIFDETTGELVEFYKWGERQGA